MNTESAAGLYHIVELLHCSEISVGRGTETSLKFILGCWLDVEVKIAGLNKMFMNE